MQNMWNAINTNFLLMGHNGNGKQLFGPNTTQKRYFGYDYPNIALDASKNFDNPNFVNKGHPRIHSYQNGHHEYSCQTDNPSNENFSKTEVPYSNSSQSLIETIKEKKLDIVHPRENINFQVKDISEPIAEPVDERKPFMCNKRAWKNRRKPRKSYHSHKNPDKNIKSMRKELNEMMEVDSDSQNYSTFSEVSMSPKEHQPLTLSDFITDNNSLEKENVDENCEANEEPDTDSTSSSNIANSFKRERTLSIAESEDSFIVFESGTDDELEFSEYSQEDESDECEDCEESDEDEVDYSPSVVPQKKVRFADDNELCEVHPMIMWSYAYQKARIGPWQKYAIDRVRFKDHIKQLEEKIKPVLDPRHRDKIFVERFQDEML